MSTKTAPANADQALLDYVLELRARLLAAGGGSAQRTEVDTADIDADLRANHPAAEAAITAAHTLLSAFTSRLQTARTNMGSLDHVARVMASRLADVFAAVDADTADAASTARVRDAERTISELETRQATALARLEAAVNAADVDTVMALRPGVEVEIPGRIDAARLELVDARLTLSRGVLATGTTRTTITQQRLDAAHAELDAARKAAEQAEKRAHDAQEVHAITSTGTAAATGTIRQLEREREQLAASLDTDRQARFRRLAGLPEPVTA